jgi:hypothetical protein
MNAHSPSLARQAWLEAAMAALKGRIEAAHGSPVPDTVRISSGFPKGSHGKGKAIGQCWATEVSADKHNEIFISPELSKSVRIMGVIAHELVHATVGVKAGHKAPFKKLAEAIGLAGKMTATVESEAFTDWAQGVVNAIGEYPAGAMNLLFRKKQTTRMLKCECEDCGYSVRTTRKWIEQAGPPVCPTDMTTMQCDEIDGDDGE